MNSGPDDIDRLFSRLEAVSPPADLESRILTQVAWGRRPPAVDRRWAGIALLGLLVLAFVGYRLGQQLATGGTLEFVTSFLADWGSFTEAPGDFLAGALPALPLAEVAAVAANLVAIALAVRLALRQVPPGRSAVR
jgi:hypothetical protein